MKIGILVCDTPLPIIVQEYGNYYTLFSQLLTNLDSSIESIGFDVLDFKYPLNPNEFDGFIITGSKYSAYETIPWILKLQEFIKILIISKIPLVGICFGHQMIAQAMGGSVIKNEVGWEVGWTRVDLNSHGKSYFEKECLYIHSMHQDHVSIAPHGFTVLGSSDKSPIQIMKSDSCLTFQGHPEFNSGIVNHILKFRLEKQVYSVEFVNHCLLTLNQPVDNQYMVKCIVDFLSSFKG